MVQLVIIGVGVWLGVFGPPDIPPETPLWLYAVWAFIGLAIFVAIGVSKHPEAYKVRRFGAAVASAFVVTLLVVGATRLLHYRP